MIADDIIAAARSELETPFRHQGRLSGIGLDCAGLLIVVAKQLGFRPMTPDAYGRTPANGLLEATLDAQDFLKRVAVQDLKPGDVLLMRFANEPQHVAIYAGETVIHSYESARKVVEHRLDDAWAKRIVRVYRFDEVLP